MIDDSGEPSVFRRAALPLALVLFGIVAFVAFASLMKGPASGLARLKGGTEIHGTVVDADTGRPIAGARVFTRTRVLESRTYEARTNAAGEFTMRMTKEVVLGLAPLEVSAVGYFPRTATAADLRGRIALRPVSAPASGGSGRNP